MKPNHATFQLLSYATALVVYLITVWLVKQYKQLATDVVRPSSSSKVGINKNRTILPHCMYTSTHIKGPN